MENVLLTILLINALLLIGVVLLQRSEGGGLGMGGGGAVMTGRAAATALAKLTWIFGATFMVCSLALTVVAAHKARDASVIGQTPAAASAPATPDVNLPAGSDLLPPPATGDAGTAPAPGSATQEAPATPPRAD